MSVSYHNTSSSGVEHQMVNTGSLSCDNSPFLQLPSFNTFNKYAHVGGRANTSTANTSTDTEDNTSYQSSDSSEQIFSIDNILHHSSVPRSSTPYTEVLATNGQLESYRQPMSAPGTVKIPATTSANDTARESAQKIYRRQNDKPPYSYAAMCATVIEGSAERALTLGGVRDKLADMFPFFRGAYTGWKDSVRHCLSYSKCFYKVIPQKDTRRSGVNHLWKVDPNHLTSAMFRRQRGGVDSLKYREYLHEELGEESVLCMILKRVEKEKNGHTVNNILLPAQPCFKAIAAVATETDETDDFLRARKDNNDVENSSCEAFSVTTSLPSDFTADRGRCKRKREQEVGSPVKKRKTLSPSETSTTQTKIPYSSMAPGSQYNITQYLEDTAQTSYGQYQLPCYHPYQYSQPYGYALHNQSAVYGDPILGYSYNNSWPGHIGMQTTMDMWHYQHNYHQSRDESYHYDYRWYSAPATTTGIDLRKSLDEEQ